MPYNINVLKVKLAEAKARKARIDAQGLSYLSAYNNEVYKSLLGEVAYYQTLINQLEQSPAAPEERKK